MSSCSPNGISEIGTSSDNLKARLTVTQIEVKAVCTRVTVLEVTRTVTRRRAGPAAAAVLRAQGMATVIISESHMQFAGAMPRGSF